MTKCPDNKQWLYKEDQKLEKMINKYLEITTKIKNIKNITK